MNDTLSILIRILQRSDTSLCRDTDLFTSISLQNCYPMTKKRRGFCLIIDIEKFRDASKNRDGSDLDSSNLKALFHAFGFEIMLYKNLSELEIQQVLKDFARDHKGLDVDMAAVFIMSHGTRKNVDSPDGREDFGCVFQTTDNKLVSYSKYM